MNANKDNRIIQPYLFFNDRCEEAVEFYRKALGAEVEVMMRFKDSPEPHQPGTIPSGFENKIMHTSFRIGQTTVMASDGCSAEKPGFQGFSLSLAVPNESEAERVSRRWPTPGRCGCRWQRRSGAHALAWWRIASA
jgi:PhnB protein